MKFHPDTGIDSLLDLLDDEDESIAVYAMGELLDREAQLGDALGALQESGSPLLRRRIHQLQAAITLRRRRRRFREFLKQPEIDLKQGLFDVHLQWFDNDSRPDIERRWAKFFVAAGGGSPLRALTRLSSWMRKYGMTAVQESSMQPENYCIGTVLENRQGASSLLCAAGMVLLQNPEIRTVRMLGEFALADSEHRILLPLRDWQVLPLNGTGTETGWPPVALLKYLSGMLFNHAVISDSFRYVQTISQALTGISDGELPETLPYPYRATEDPDETNQQTDNEEIS